ncbi:TPA: hypothetical protein JLA97_003939 [Escherichia coli]|nr:hypothetical protein [Escherichia coli]
MGNVAGWGKPRYSKLAHYFDDGEQISLCGKFSKGNTELTDAQEMESSLTIGDCSKCRKALYELLTLRGLKAAKSRDEWVINVCEGNQELMDELLKTDAVNAIFKRHYKTCMRYKMNDDIIFMVLSYSRSTMDVKKLRQYRHKVMCELRRLGVIVDNNVIKTELKKRDKRNGDWKVSG